MMNYLNFCILAAILSIFQFTRNVGGSASAEEDYEDLGPLSHQSYTDEDNIFKHDALITHTDHRGFFYTCSGTIISDYHILTAAHCVIKNGTKLPIDALLDGVLKVQVGIKRVDGQNETHTMRLVEAIYWHDDFEHVTDPYRVHLVHADFAVLKLNHKLGLGRNWKIAKLELPHYSGYVFWQGGHNYPVEFGENYYENSVFTYTGFGITYFKHLIYNGIHYDYKEKAEYLHFSDAKVVETSKCSHSHHDVKLCAKLLSGPDAMTCVGDSGGALFNRNTNEIIGLVSSGGIGCSQFSRTTYTKVVVFTNMIEAAMNNSKFEKLKMHNYSNTYSYQQELYSNFGKYNQIDVTP